MNKTTETFYQREEVAQEYEEIRFQDPAGRLLDTLQKKAMIEGIGSLDLSGRKILDVACGTGRFSRLFRSRGAEVVGLDLSRAMIHQSRARESAGAYIEASALSLPFRDQAFDVAVSVNAFNHLPQYEQAIGEICRVSQRVLLGLPHQNSLLLLVTLYRILRGWGYRGTRYKTEPYHGSPLVYTRYFSERELESVFQRNHFKIVRSRRCWVFPFPYVPRHFIRAAEILERMSIFGLGRFGTFMAVMAERPLKGR